MDKQSISETNEQIQGSKHILTTIIAVILTAVIVGSGIYVWQESNLRRTEQSLRQQLIDLENQIKNQKTTETIVDNTEEAENIIEKPSQTV